MCEKVQKDWTREWNDEQKVPFAHNNFHWVSYEDLESLKIKVNIFCSLITSKK
jgi:GH18 family chitinase